jgi:diaminohydroxyphosphoribosylaminopyrimidine deaminase/5-amino-6-(5-phosphoribosylamino)uracil reductase
MTQDEVFMQLALREAKKGRYQTWKNPLVGAVVVKNGQVFATGYHHHYGDQHAERDAIAKLTPEQLSNSTLYVTLEPCNHYGKQPPCSELVATCGIKRVVIAQVDPHQLVTGKGIATLKKHGLAVATGVLAKQARQLNEHYSWFYEHNRPWLTIKQAVSLDHKVSAKGGLRTNITNDAVYERVHQERASYQAIVIGSTTALVDNPSLGTTVQTDYPPLRIVMDRRGRLLQHLDLKLLTDGQPTWLFTQNKKLASQPFKKGVQCFLTKNDDLHFLLTTLTVQEIQSVYVEGGPSLAQAFFDEFSINELITYLAPNLLGQNGVEAFCPAQAKSFDQVAIEQLGDNVRIAERKNNV